MWTIKLLKDAALLVEYIYNQTYNLGDAVLLAPIANEEVVKRAHDIMVKKMKGE